LDLCNILIVYALVHEECYVRRASDFIFGEDFHYNDFQLFMAHILFNSYNFL